MICPLSLAGANTHTEPFEPCAKEKCAWWHPALKQCSITVLAIRAGMGIKLEITEK